MTYLDVDLSENWTAEDEDGLDLERLALQAHRVLSEKWVPIESSFSCVLELPLLLITYVNW